MGNIPLDAAFEAHAQTGVDLRIAIEDAMAADRVSDRLAMHTCLAAMRYIERHGLTDVGRRQLVTAIECCRSVLNMEG